jgi:hypothetical protein
VLKPATGYTASILRKSIEQESLRLHMEDAAAFPLSMCAEVCSRCMHKPATAMQSYVRRGLAALGGTAESEEEIEPGGTETETTGEDEAEAAPPSRRRLVRQRAVEEDDGDLDLPPEEPMEPEAADEISPAASIALLVRLANGSTHTFHHSVFAAAYLVDTEGRDLARADTAFDDGTLQVTWDEGDIGVFPAITEPPPAEPPAAPTAEAPEAAEAAEAPEAAEAGPAMQALLAAMAAAHESDRAAKRRRTD